MHEQNPLDVIGSFAERGPLIRTLGAKYGSRRRKGGPEMVERIAMSLKPDFAPGVGLGSSLELRCYQFWGPFGKSRERPAKTRSFIRPPLVRRPA